MTQEHLAKILNVNQPAISKMERRADMYVSTLQDFVKAMGGQLEIRAVFPDGTVRITQFSELGKGGGPGPQTGAGLTEVRTKSYPARDSAGHDRALTRRRALVCSGGGIRTMRCERTAHPQNMPCAERMMP